MKEIWKGVIYQQNDYSERLEVSTFGRLRNAKNKKEYKLQIGKTGYYQTVISLGERGNVKLIKIHRAVAETFIPNNEDLPVINHKDLNKLNNKIENLEWCTQRYNTLHAIKNGAIKFSSGCERNNSDFQIKDIEYILDNYIPKDKKYGCRALAKRFNVSHSRISDIINNKAYKTEIAKLLS